ncbi:MAG: response regulator transcription factor [Caldilineaceae bacterium]|nr:response regulator transcription factor [Caldilineaceae bacterium]
MTKHILVVDDDSLIRRAVAVNLEQAGYTALLAESGEDALRHIAVRVPDLILLDIGLPGMDGLQALRAIHQQVPGIPVVFLTARRRELDEIVGLELGADDYITKPFDMDVLLAHVKAVLRRVEPVATLTEEEIVVAGDLRMVPGSYQVQIGDRSIELPPKEFELLLTLARNPGRVFSVDELMDQVWGSTWIGETQTIYVHIRWLRQKIEEDPTHPQRLVTIRGAGYKLMALQG